MASRKTELVVHNARADSTKAVDEFMAKLDHPFKDDVESIRRLILGVHPSIAEGIKWNAPSFRTTEYFATTNLRVKGGIGIILHMGAKVRKLPADFSIADPMNLLKWLGKDRATVEFTDSKDFAAKKAGFENIIRQWIRYLEPA